MVTRYYRDSDVGLYEPAKTNPSFFEGSSSGTALVDNVNALNAAKAQKIRVTGETKLKSVQHVKTDLAPRHGPGFTHARSRSGHPGSQDRGRSRRLRQRPRRHTVGENLCQAIRFVSALPSRQEQQAAHTLTSGHQRDALGSGEDRRRRLPAVATRLPKQVVLL